VRPSVRLVPISDDLWVAEGPNVEFFGLCYPTRMVVARLPDGLWIWSPVALDPALREAIDALGEVAWLVSPNKIHHLFLAPWQAAYPRAQLCGLAQVAGKRRDLRFDRLLDDQPPLAWAGHVDQVVVRGSVVMEEVGFFHRASETLIVADLIENFERDFLDAHWKPWQIRLARWAGIVAPDGQAPLDFRTSFLRRKPARAAVATILSWAPRRVIMAHGAIVSEDAVAFLERSFRWLK